MRYQSLRHCVEDLAAHGQLIKIKAEVDPYLEAAEIHRRVQAVQGPALLFESLKGTSFPAVSNLFGTMERSNFIFRNTQGPVKKIIGLKADPRQALRAPWRYVTTPFNALCALPKRVRTGPVLQCETTIDQLPLITSWPMDGGAFITLPQVYSEDPHAPGPMQANIGMYRIQMNGNQYKTNKEIGLHYQIHRGIGVHHAKAIARNEPLKVCIFVGGPPAHTVAAMMPLPEGLSEVLFAGMLAGRRMRFSNWRGYHIAVDSDFCIVGTIDPNRTLPEGPFGDHLGYYSLTHPFPVLNVEKVFHRPDAIWPFTVVGRPPQEDSSFGELVHNLTSEILPKELPGVTSLNAVDAAGVHPLLLAVGQERYVPYADRKPQELLTLANSILGFGQCSLAKYLIIAAQEDDPNLSAKDIRRHLEHVLRRVRWERDLHFQTETTIDTLDYSGTDLNSGSKLVIAAAGEIVRNLGTKSPFPQAKLAMPGVLVTSLPTFSTYENAALEIDHLERGLREHDLTSYPLIVITDDPDFVASDFSNFLWVTFTRSNPSHDVYGVQSFTKYKHWGCHGPLIIDARRKPHHAPPLEQLAEVNSRVDAIIRSVPELRALNAIKY